MNFLKTCNLQIFRWHGEVQIESSLDDDAAVQDDKKKEDSGESVIAESLSNASTSVWTESMSLLSLLFSIFKFSSFEANVAVMS